jgi:hypothetical protein
MDVSPTRYEGLFNGVQIREMITTQNGAPTFAMRIFDVTLGSRGLARYTLSGKDSRLVR